MGNNQQQTFIEKWMPLWMPAVSVVAASLVTIFVLQARIDFLEKRVDKHDILFEKHDVLFQKAADGFADIKGDIREMKTIIKEYLNNNRR